jgi:hypothetical protein
MSEQIFISYRREGGDIYAKAICDALKVRGYSVFYDFDSLQGGYFDDRIYRAIEECNDFVLVLPPNSLDRCVNEDDWVRLEIGHAIKFGKNIIPVMLPDFSFPKNLPADIANIARINGIPLIMQFFDHAVIPAIIDRFSSSASRAAQPTVISEPTASNGLEFTLNFAGTEYSVSFDNCTDNDVIIPKLYKGKPVTSINTSCTNFSIDIPPRRSEFASFTIPDSITTIGKNAFRSCEFLTSITIPNSVTAIGESAFYDCESLFSIDIPNGVTVIEEKTFYDCRALQSINIPNSVKSIGAGAFSGCEFLDPIDIPNGVMSIGAKAFSFCESLVSIDIPNGVTVIEEKTFCDCIALQSINIPNSVKSIGDLAFWNCESLNSIDIPNGVMSIGVGAFNYCKSLVSIDIPNGVTVIEKETFYNCSALQSINIPNSVTAIGQEAFSNCKSLTSITIPNSVISIGEKAFHDCNSLKSVSFNGTIDQWRKIIKNTEGKIIFPEHIKTVRCTDGDINII